MNLLKFYILIELYSALMMVHDLLKQSDFFGLHRAQNQDDRQSPSEEVFH
jgi:hypothetical protein